MSGGVFAEIWRLLSETVNGVFASLLTAAVAGRLAWHTRLAQKGERNFIGKEMAFEAASVLFLFYVSKAAIEGAVWFLAEHTRLAMPEDTKLAVAQGAAALIAYFGPGGIQAGIVAVWKWWSTRGKA